MVISESLVFYHIRNVSQTAPQRHDIRGSRMHRERYKTGLLVAESSCVRPSSSRRAERTLLLLSKQRKISLPEIPTYEMGGMRTFAAACGKVCFTQLPFMRRAELGKPHERICGFDAPPRTKVQMTALHSCQRTLTLR